MHEKEKDKNSKILFNFSSRFLFSIREHCIFPLEEKSKSRRRRRRRRVEKKKGSSREGRTGRRRKVDPGKIEGSYTCTSPTRRPLPVRREERACGKPDSIPLPVGGLDDPAQVRRDREGWNVAQVHAGPFSTRIL